MLSVSLTQITMQLLCSHWGPKWSHAFNSAGFKHDNQVQQQVIQFHPKITPETISEGQKSKIFLEGMPQQAPYRAVIAYWNSPFQNSRSATEKKRQFLKPKCLQDLEQSSKQNPVPSDGQQIQYTEMVVTLLNIVVTYTQSQLIKREQQ